MVIILTQSNYNVETCIFCKADLKGYVLEALYKYIDKLNLKLKINVVLLCGSWF